MKPVVRIVVLLAALLSLSATSVSPASASTVQECQGDLATLRADTVAAQGSFTNAKDFNSLVGKLDAASANLTAGKNADAIQKLVDFQTKLNALASAAKPKVDPDVAEALVGDAQGVIDCINSVGT
jgi:hypothetical protein